MSHITDVFCAYRAPAEIRAIYKSTLWPEDIHGASFNWGTIHDNDIAAKANKFLKYKDRLRKLHKFSNRTDVRT